MTTHADGVRDLMRADPLVPFSLHLADGQSVEVRRGGEMLVMDRIVEVARLRDDGGPVDTTQTVRLEDIRQIETAQRV